jgi:hypothetical protein
METTITTERNYVIRAIELLAGVGMKNPSIKDIRFCVNGLKNGEKYVRKWYAKKNKLNPDKNDSSEQ